MNGKPHKLAKRKKNRGRENSLLWNASELNRENRPNKEKFKDKSKLRINDEKNSVKRNKNADRKRKKLVLGNEKKLNRS
jgi:hypothetical protein